MPFIELPGHNTALEQPDVPPENQPEKTEDKPEEKEEPTSDSETNERIKIADEDAAKARERIARLQAQDTDVNAAMNMLTILQAPEAHTEPLEQPTSERGTDAQLMHTGAEEVRKEQQRPETIENTPQTGDGGKGRQV